MNEMAESAKVRQDAHHAAGKVWDSEFYSPQICRGDVNPVHPPAGEGPPGRGQRDLSGACSGQAIPASGEDIAIPKDEIEGPESKGRFVTT